MELYLRGLNNNIYVWPIYGTESRPNTKRTFLTVLAVFFCRTNHSDLRDYISDTTRSFRRMHAWRLTRFISR